MEIRKHKNSAYEGNVYEFSNDGFKTTLVWLMAGSLDVCWVLRSSKKQSLTEIIINKEDYQIYKSIDEIYNEISNYEDDSIGRDYKKIIDLEKQEITWFGDKENIESATCLKIKKTENQYRIAFKGERASYQHEVCFRSSGSRYGYAFLPFAGAFKELTEFKFAEFEFERETTEQLTIDNYIEAKRLTKQRN